MGRDVTHAEELTDEINENAKDTVDKVNRLLTLAGRVETDTVNSGWRPRSIRDPTQNNLVASLHLTAEAVDIGDTDRSLAHWCMENLDLLEAIELWMEDARWTPTWVHLQTVPPRSGKIVFIPNNSPPTDPTFA
jgi:hypothetical protein